ncbi:Transmembrane And Death Domain Protein 1 [Manis pentadactyla]|nr:Transmembrane And Death Domain Protein 1 [Manis pentadactyla]
MIKYSLSRSPEAVGLYHEDDSVLSTQGGSYLGGSFLLITGILASGKAPGAPKPHEQHHGLSPSAPRDSVRPGRRAPPGTRAGTRGPGHARTHVLDTPSPTAALACGCSNVFEDSRKAVLTKDRTNDSQRKEVVQPRAVKAVSRCERMVSEQAY